MKDNKNNHEIPEEIIIKENIITIVFVILFVLMVWL